MYLIVLNIQKHYKKVPCLYCYRSYGWIIMVDYP